MRRTSSASAPELPERLRYLQPFRKKFASHPEELNEDSGTDPLMQLLAKRIHGQSIEDAARILEGDRAALDQWLSALGEAGDPLHFAKGFFLLATTEELAAQIKEDAEKPPEPKLCLQMELPVGGKLRRLPGGAESGRVVTLKGIWLGIDVVPEAAVESLRESVLQDTSYPTREVAPVAFGQVTGQKIVFKGESALGAFKKITYVLAVPGGHVHGSLAAVGKKVDQLNWDEAPFEACFHTLRVETKPASPPRNLC